MNHPSSPTARFVLGLLTCVAVLITAATGAVSASETTAPHAQTAHYSPDGYTVGVCTHFVQRKGLLPANIAMIRAAGVESIRDEVPWDVVERNKGTYEIPERVDAYVDAALEAGMEVMLVLDYGNRHYEKGMKPKAPESIKGFVNYSRAIVEHFKGRVNRYEVWNEWNIGIGTATGEKGTPEGYIKLIEPTYRAIKEIDPSIEVIGAVVAPQALGDGFFEKLVGLGLTEHCDAVSVHTYNYAAQPVERRRPEAWLERMRQIQQTVRDGNGGAPMPLYVTEHGWPTHRGATGTPEHRSADFLARMYLLSRTLEDLGGIWWYDFQDDGWKPQYNEDNFGLVYPDLTPKPSYFVMRDIAEFFRNATYEAQIETENPNVWILKFRKGDGSRVLAVWAAGQEYQVVLEPTDGATGEPVHLRAIGRAPIERHWHHKDWVGKPQNEVVERLAVTAGATPLLIEIPQGDVRIEAVQQRRHEAP